MKGYVLIRSVNTEAIPVAGWESRTPKPFVITQATWDGASDFLKAEYEVMAEHADRAVLEHMCTLANEGDNNVR